MKKITAFFMAILPFFVLVLLFVSGLIIKSNVPVHVSAVSITRDDFTKQVGDLGNPEQTGIQLDARVFPSNASNPTVYWVSQNPNIVEVSKKTGDATAKAYGETYVYAYSEEDNTKVDRVKIEIYDNKIHDLSISNQYQLGYVGLNQPTKIEVDTVPSQHIENKTLLFESEDKKVLDVTSDGWVIPKAEGTSKVTVAAQSDTSIKKTVDVTIGKGVSKIEFNNQAATVTDAQIYDLRDEILTYPETDKSKITNSDFEFTVSDESVASVVLDYNIIKFKKQEPVVVTATYKRNTNLKISKTLYSTCNSLLSVNFDANEYETTLDVVQQGDKYVYQSKEIENLNINIYPNSNNLFKDLNVESSDNNVVEPKWDVGNSKWIFTAKKPGTVTLLVTAGTGSTAEPYKFDACLVKVLSPTQGRHEKDLAIIKEKAIALDNGNYYYPLWNNLTLDIWDKSSQKISFKVDSGDAAYIDDNNILQFTKDGTVTIKVFVDGNSTSSIFDVTANKGATEIAFDESKTTYQIEAGKRYKFTNATPIFEGQSYENKFNVTDNEFSATCGQSISEFKINKDGKEKTIKLIVSEKPLYISYDIDTYYPTSEVEINFFDLANASIVPSTALKPDGSAYSLSYTYTPASESVATIENNVITFRQAGMVDVRIDCDTLHPAVFKIKSSFGGLDKFDVYDGVQKIASNYYKEISPTQTATFTISGLSSSEAKQIEMEPVSLTKLCTVSKETTGLLPKTVTFKVTAPSDMYGIETFAIKTKTYTTYVNIKVSSEIQGFEVMYNNQVLKTGTSEAEINTTFTNSLELDVLPYPISAMGQGQLYNVKDESGNDVDHTNNKIKLENLTAGAEKKLIFSWTVAGGEKTQTYIIKYDSDISHLKISLSETDKNNNVYFGSNETARTFHLSTNGFVSKEFFTSEKFSGKLDKTTAAKVEIKNNLLTISGITNPDGKEFTDTLTLSYDGTTINTFNVGRDIVSKVELPRHDNTDKTDKKGLQRVHVYGNLSYYTKEEGLIDYYKLPIKIYDYKGFEIVNTTENPTAKADAIKTLVLDINKNATAEYDAKQDCIKVKFNVTNFYSEQEIANNEFDAKNGNKNVTIDVHTKSNQAKADYTFVSVKGINVYCQQGLEMIRDDQVKTTSFENKSRTAVLQTNFGLQPEIKDNVPYEADIDRQPGIYGNGYTLCNQWSTLNKELAGTNFSFCINAVLQQCYDDTYKTLQSKTLDGCTIDKFEGYNYFSFEYSIYKNWGNGIFIREDDYTVHIKNSLFYNNKLTSFYCNHQNVNMYIENIVLFDVGGLPILNVFENKMFFKGYIGIYNFHNKEMLQDIYGVDISFMWDTVAAAARLAGMIEVGADGREYINSFMCNALNKEIYFWNNTTKQYERGTKGTPDAANFIGKYISLAIPFTKINGDLWGTISTAYDPNAFSYYQEFNPDGTVKKEFFQQQIDKVTRQINFF